MREKLTIDLSTGQQSTREFTEEEDNIVEQGIRKWEEEAERRRKDVDLIKAKAAEDPVFAALLRVLGVN